MQRNLHHGLLTVVVALVGADAPAVGQTLVGHGQVLNYGGRHAVCRADVYALSGTRKKLVATALATIFQVKP